MSLPPNIEERYNKIISSLVGIIALLLITIVGLVMVFYKQTSSSNATSMAADSKPAASSTPYWAAPDPATLEGNTDKALILYGKDMIVHTADYFGPQGKVNKAATNGMNCQNCHMEAGTKVFGNNYSAVASTYPKYRPRSGAVENIYKRVNDCLERSLNGKAVDTASKEMQAITAYIKWLGSDVAKGVKPVGSGLKDMAFLDRAASPDLGKAVYITKCKSCHNTNGEGMVNADHSAFVYPPLWGQQSYNTGAGLYRLSSFAKFVKCNMPFGASHNQPQLSDEEAWDVAAYVNTQPRPQMDVSKDWPKPEEKSFDNPAGPYVDGFSEAQHKLGPFKPIADKLALLKKPKP